MGKTIAEKILSSHAGHEARAGETVVADIDFCFGQDGTSSIVIDSFYKMGGKTVFDAQKCAVIIDHSAPSPLAGVSAIHKKMREFAREQKIHMYDIGCGVCHQLSVQEGHVVCGDLVVGADSHTCTYGAINALSTGMGSTDIAVAMYTGKNWFKVPESIKFICKGTWPLGVYSKDLILYMIGDITSEGATYYSCEFVGDAVDSLSVDARFTISNMAIEMGAKCGIMLADEKVKEWVKQHSCKSFKPVEPDKDARYALVKEYDVSDLEPQVARPHTVDNVCGISEVAGLPVQQAFLGTCTNGRLEDLKIASEILRGKKVNSDTRLIVAPASKDVFLDAVREGIIQILVEAGAVVVTPGCGCCVGTHNGVPSNGEKVISTANRNFKGRMGNPDSEIYLASPATVAASSLEGRIADPRKYV